MNSHAAGIVFVVLDSLAFSLMSLCVKEAGDLPSMQKAFFRNVIAAAIALMSLAFTPDKFRINKGSLPMLFARSAFGTIGILMNFWAIDHIALADANILNKMSPFFAMIASIFILSEMPNAFEWITLVIGFTGAAFIVKPTAGVASLPALLALVGGMGAGIAYTFVRKLGNHGERGNVIVAFFSVFSCLVCLPQILLNFQPMEVRQWIFLILAGVCGAAGQFFVTKAYQMAPAKEISVFDYSQVLFASMWGLIFFSEVPDCLSVIGYVVVISTAVVKWYYNVFVQERK